MLVFLVASFLFWLVFPKSRFFVMIYAFVISDLEVGFICRIVRLVCIPKALLVLRLLWTFD